MRHGRQRWLKPAGLAGLAVALLIVIVGLVSRGLASQKLKAWTDAEAIPTVSVIAPTQASGAETLVLPGDVEAFYNAQIHARVSGYLKHWYTDIGAPVRAGQVLADIDTPELDQQLVQARANLGTAVASQKLAQTTAARWSSLLTDDAVSRQEADEKSSDLAVKQSLVKAAQAEVQRIEALEAFKKITAPFAGVVTGRTTDIGALIAAGAPNDPGLFTVADVHRLRIYVKVPQSYSADLHPGMSASLTAPEHPGQTFTATLATTAGAVSDQSGTMLTELQIDNPDGALKPGDYAQVSFALPPAPGLIRLPASALMLRQSGMAVAILGPDDRVTMKSITIARDLGATVEVASGLSPRDQVIDSPPDSLTDGEKVRVPGRAAASPQRGRAELCAACGLLASPPSWPRSRAARSRRLTTLRPTPCQPRSRKKARGRRPRRRMRWTARAGGASTTMRGSTSSKAASRAAIRPWPRRSRATTRPAPSPPRPTPASIRASAWTPASPATGNRTTVRCAAPTSPISTPPIPWAARSTMSSISGVACATWPRRARPKLWPARPTWRASG